MNDRKADGIKTIKSIFSYSIANIIALIVSLLSIPILTRIISVSDLGVSTSFSTLQNILTIICLLSIYIAIDRMLLDVKKKEFEFLSSIYLFSDMFAVVIFIIYFIFRKYLNIIFGFDTWMMLLMFSFIILTNGCTLLVAYWNFKNKYKYTFLYNLFVSPVSQILSLILSYLFIKNKYLGRILGLNIFNVCFGFFCGIYIVRKGKFKFKWGYVKEALFISLPMIPHLLAQVLLTSCDLLMIKNMIGLKEAGIYSMAYTISNILYTVLLQLFSPWSPWFYRRMHNDELDSIKNNSKILMIFSAFLCLGLFTVAPEMIHLFLRKEYMEAIYIIPPICIGIYFEIMYKFFYDVEYFYKRNKLIAIFSVSASIINIILNYFGLKIFGYRAAAYTTLISYLILLILHYIGMKKVEKRVLFDTKFLMLISIILLILGYVNIIIVYNFILRYVLLLLIGILLFIKYKNLLLNLLYIFIKKEKVDFKE